MNAAREEVRLPKRECNRNVRFHKELNCVSANKDTMDVSSGVPCRSGGNTNQKHPNGFARGCPTCWNLDKTSYQIML